MTLPADLILSVYSAFREVPMPLHSVDGTHCEECAEYETVLYGVAKENLSVETIGTVCWGPVSALTPEGMVYYLPRLLELAMIGVRNKDGEPFVCQFLNQVARYGEEARQFSQLSEIQRCAVRECLRYISGAHAEEIREHNYEDELTVALEAWHV